MRKQQTNSRTAIDAAPRSGKQSPQHLRPRRAGLLLALGGGLLPLNALANTAPVISGTPPASVTSGQAYLFTPTASDADGDPLSFEVSNLPAWASFDPATGTISGTPSQADSGTYRYIKVGANDGTSTSWFGNFTIKVNNALPVVTVSLPTTLNAGDYFSATPSAQDPDGSPLTYRVDHQPPWTQFDPVTGTLSGTPTQDDVGTYRYVKIGANDGVGTGWSSNTRIKVLNQAPLVGSPPTDRAEVGQLYQWTPEASDPNGGTLSFSIENLPPWASFDSVSGTLSGVPSVADIGNYKKVRVIVSDGLALTRTDRFTISVDPANNGPQIGGTPPRYVPVGAHYRFSPTYYDPDGYNTLSFTVSGLPGWATFDPASGAISGTPSAADLGQSSDGIVISVSDGREQSQTPAFSIQVIDPATDTVAMALADGDVSWLMDDAPLLQAAIAEIDPADPQQTPLLAMLEHFLAADYAYDFSNCSKKNCSDLPDYKAEFLDGAELVRDRLIALDKARVALFEQPDLRLEKLLVLLGDYYRRDIRYPMDRVSTDNLSFLRAYYADHAVYNSRALAPAQPDLGNFSRPLFGHVAAADLTVDRVSAKNFRAAGVYAFPGETFRVTRLDNSPVSVGVRINTQRKGSTHEFEANKYIRPKFLKSPSYPIAPGETIQLTSSYGGPIQLDFNANGEPVSLHFEHVGQHPSWRGAADNAGFAAAIEQGDYDWAELVTPGFEIHSTLENMRASVAAWGGAEGLAATTVRYSYDLPHALAGLHGDGITPLAEVESIAAQHGWAFKTLDKVQHVNSDQATCGTGCSGNPYDIYKPFDPLGHGPLHELGHGLQGPWRFDGWVNHTMTNPYSYFSKSVYHQQTGAYPDCQKRDFAKLYQVVQDAALTADPKAAAQAALMPNGSIYWGDGAAIYIQFMMAAQASGMLESGWHLRALTHLIEYNFARARKNDTDWLMQRDGLGFGTYSRDEAGAIGDNDFLLISISQAVGLDYRPLLDLYGIDYSQKAADQVAALGLPATPVAVYASPPRDFCESLDRPAMPVDGVTPWPG